MGVRRRCACGGGLLWWVKGTGKERRGKGEYEGMWEGDCGKGVVGRGLWEGGKKQGHGG